MALGERVPTHLRGRRVVLRPLSGADFEAWREVRAKRPQATLVVAARFAFEELGLHRLQVAIIPRNRASRRVVEKLELREEGIAFRYLAINGVWEDHIRYALTTEDWAARREELLAAWVGEQPRPQLHLKPRG